MTSLLIARDGPVATVTLNRPEVRNAFDDALIAALTEAFAELGGDGQIRVVVLAASGKAFCAGADLAWMRRMADYTHAENLADATALATMLRTIHECPKPVVARVQGDVFAGGMGLVAASDIAVAVDSARFCLSEVKLGLIPATIAPYVIAALGPRAAQRFVLTAEVFSAETAARTGFVHEIAGAEALDAAVARYVQAFLNASPAALAAGKRLLREAGGRAVDDALVADTARRIADIRASHEGREGVQSFLNKTKPSWLAGDQ
ncbi:methylglutaconyl-CoA hydratase [Pseudochelatococcus lubricantis]|uniref:Methylglutaconyl-CoA hydratase n=1 Tax=Pseudochelatococcus lubricantis TaxID=1538102 RepID=A0ABX0UXG4_9HYPH|nr:enoyl-CoA hydratase/isomerase family protein [Pseudochelatococcus lubricantis]NIJ56969.1 methylglutaconyl-CoA hydratase [Pseudochelatococcus lubricantis]